MLDKQLRSVSPKHCIVTICYNVIKTFSTSKCDLLLHQPIGSFFQFPLHRLRRFLREKRRSPMYYSRNSYLQVSLKVTTLTAPGLNRFLSIAPVHGLVNPSEWFNAPGAWEILSLTSEQSLSRARKCLVPALRIPSSAAMTPVSESQWTGGKAV